MNTILITGTVKHLEVSNKLKYNVCIWAAKEGEQIQLARLGNIITDGYNDLWHIAKYKVKEYFNEDKFADGAYTTYLDNIAVI